MKKVCIFFLLFFIMCCGRKLSNEIQAVVHYDNGYIERKLGDQIVDVQIIGLDNYTSMARNNLEYQWISSGLFLYWCSSCHGGNNAVDDTGLYDYDKPLSEYLLVVDPNHGKWKDKYNLDLDIFDIEAISAFVERKRR